MEKLNKESREYLHAKSKVEALLRLRLHYIVFVVVIILLIILNLYTSYYLWVFWVVLAWLVGLILKTVKYFTLYSKPHEDLIQKEIQKSRQVK